MIISDLLLNSCLEIGLSFKVKELSVAHHIENLPVQKAIPN